MSRDYSNYGKGKKSGGSRSKSRSQTTRRKAPPARKNNGGMFWFISGLAVGSLATAMILVPGMRPELPVADTRPAPVEQSEPEFEFHSLLRHDEVVVQQEAPIREVEATPPAAQKPQQNNRGSATETQAAAPAQPVAIGEIFLVQAGSFSKKQDAETRRVQLMLMNFTNADIENVRASSGQVRYRVIVGPFDSQGKMTTALNRISSQGIETLPIKRKR
ncbi:SPOR domain-containing protein [Porticoccus sp. W117]|uniref:SPOR domain-containing protein n=1 Tax=Porticoccus sp. W117 TaxID=3054777 RepID=UPI0025995157|nr:SPOR domain-containing protein [Porticoccus sp. W117]MDM3872528.1 SPOR domain-containing protein [Porticoccus sp. W117]